MSDEIVRNSPEQEARDLLERLSDCHQYTDPQSMSSGDIVELASLIAEVRRLRRAISEEARGGCGMNEFQERFPIGATFSHCGRKCVVMRYVDEGEAMHTAGPIGMRYEYADNNGALHWGSIAEREYPAILAQNPLPPQLEGLRGYR